MQLCYFSSAVEALEDYALRSFILNGEVELSLIVVFVMNPIIMQGSSAMHVKCL